MLPCPSRQLLRVREEITRPPRTNFQAVFLEDGGRRTHKQRRAMRLRRNISTIFDVCVLRVEKSAPKFAPGLLGLQQCRFGQKPLEVSSGLSPKRNCSTIRESTQETPPRTNFPSGFLGTGRARWICPA